MADKNYFEILNGIDVSDKVEKKGELSYLSWAWAWGELKKKHPEATYTIYENENGWNYHTDGSTAWVKTGVTVNGIEHIEYLPVMDFKNKSIPLGNVTSTDVNKTIQRSLTKAIARHGLGLYIYAGEDLPDEAKAEADAKKAEVGKEKIGAAKAAALLSVLNKNEIKVEKIYELYKVKDLKELAEEKHANIMANLEKIKAKE